MILKLIWRSETNTLISIQSFQWRSHSHSFFVSTHVFHGFLFLKCKSQRIRILQIQTTINNKRVSSSSLITNFCVLFNQVNIKGSIPRCLWFAGIFLELWRLTLQHLKSIWQIILSLSRKNSFKNNFRYYRINKLYCVICVETEIYIIYSIQEKYFAFLLRTNMTYNV